MQFSWLNCNSFIYSHTSSLWRRSFKIVPWNLIIRIIAHGSFIIISFTFPLHSTGDKMDIFLFSLLFYSLNFFYMRRNQNKKRENSFCIVAVIVVVVICCRLTSRRTWCMPWHRSMWNVRWVNETWRNPIIYVYECRWLFRFHGRKLRVHCHCTNIVSQAFVLAIAHTPRCTHSSQVKEKKKCQRG